MSSIDFFVHGPDADVLGDFQGAKNTFDATLNPNIVFTDVHNPLATESARDVSARIVNVWGNRPQQYQPVVGMYQPAFQSPYDPSGVETGYYLVDQGVLVHGKTSQERAVNQEFWAFARNIAILAGSLSVAGLAASVATLALATSTAAIVAGAVAAFVTPFFAAFSFYRAHQAHEQIQQWDIDPARAVADQRAKAYRNGFFYARDHQMRAVDGRGVLFPEEVMFLYNKSFEDQNTAFAKASDLPADAKANVLHAFVVGSVLSKKSLEFISEDGTLETAPKGLLDANRQYEPFCQRVAGINDYFTGKKAEVARLHDTASQRLHREKQTQLKPYIAARDARQANIDDRFRPWIEQLRGELQELPVIVENVQAPGGPNVGRIEQRRTQLNDQISRATTEWTSQTRSLNAVYDTSIAPINNWHRQEMTRLDAWRNGQIQRIDGQRDQHLVPFFDIAKQIFDAAYAAFNGQYFDPPPYREDDVFDVVHISDFRPSAPPLQALQQRPAGNPPGYAEFMQALEETN